MEEEFSDMIISTSLYIIYKNADISELFKYGISLSQIPTLLKYIEDHGYCTRRDDTYTLTPSGYEFLNKFPALFTDSAKRVKPLFSMRIPRMSIDEIFLPKKSP